MKLHPPSRVRDYRARGWWAGESWNNHLRRYASQTPDAIAIVDAPNRGDITDGEPGAWTWRELADAVDRLAAVFVAHGIEAGDVVGVQMANVRELVQTYFALSGIGAIISPFPVQFREHELTLLGEVVGMKAIVTSARVRDRRNAEVLDALRSSIPTLELVLSWGGDVPAGVMGLDTAMAGDVDLDGLAAHCSAHPVEGDDCVTICWTSGTESVPKGIPRTHDDWICITWTQVDAARMTADDVILSPFPLVNMAGIGGTVLPWLLTGSRLVLHHPFELDLFLRQIERERITFTVASPALLTQLLQNHELLASTDIASLRVIGSGSAPLPPSTVVGWEIEHGVEIVNLYGSNEGVGLVNDAITVPEAADRATYFPRVGRPEFSWPSVRTAAWVSTKLIDVDTGEEITEPGRPGELRVGGPTLFGGYLPGQDLADPFDEEGYCRSGDLFEIAGDGMQYYRYVDRAKDIIIRGGFNISAAEIETLALAHPDVVEAAAVGYHDDILGERTCVFAVLRSGGELTLGGLCAFMAGKHIASYKLPERLVLATSLPRNALGKVVKEELRQQLRDQDAAAADRS